MCILNNIHNIYIIPTAIGDENRELITNFSIDHCSFIWNNQDSSTNQTTYKVNSYTLDFLFEKNEINNVDLIHLDVEGMELKVLYGADKLINKNMPIIIFEQHLNTDNISEIYNLLTKKNYKIFMINEVSPITLPDCRNFIAFSERFYNNKNNIITDINSNIEQNILLPCYL